MTTGRMVRAADADQQMVSSEPAMDEPKVPPWPIAFDWGLFLFRVGAFMSLFVKHGFGRLTDHAQVPWNSQSPLHVFYAAFADGICSILVILGLGTRCAALVIFLNMLVSFTLVNHFDFAKHTVAFLNNQGEVMGQYMSASVVMLIVGAGRFSLDTKLGLGPLWPLGRKSNN